jgi:protein-S-isoprenylcysteine O-methyltransferase Ste14
MEKTNLKKLKKQIYIRIPLAIIGLSLLFFLPAKTFFFYEAWIYMAIFLLPISFIILYFLKNDPELLERRMRMKEKISKQKAIIIFSYIIFLATFLIPGFDKQYGWSNVPMTFVIISDLIVLMGYLLFVLVLKENSFASRIIEVEQNQKVISTGPYALVRHPMYLAIILMFMFSPLALGSYYGLIPTITLPVLLICRLINEENLLKKDLPGYLDYTKKTKYRLIPFIW